MMATLLIFGMFPGPTMFQQQLDVVGGVFIAYFASNVALLLIGVAMTPLFVYVLRIRRSRLIPMILLLCAIGTFTLQSSIFDLWAMLGFGVIGIILRLASYPLAPIVIGVILGPLLENNFRRSLLISDNGFWIFAERPIAAVLLVVNVVLIAIAIWSVARPSKREPQYPGT